MTSLTTGSHRLMLLIGLTLFVAAAACGTDGNDDTASPTSDEAPATADAGTPSGTQVARFEATFDGTVDEGQELIDWLLEREGRAVYLDLTFADAPAETDSPPLWSNCGELPAGEQPSTAFCEAWVLHIRSDDTAEPPFRETAGVYHLEGAFVVAATAGPNQGYLSLALDPVTTETVHG